MHNERRVGLSLSGGGYRAAAFHLGTLRKLHELRILEKVDVLSTISGGSIAGAYYLLHKDDFKAFEQGLRDCLMRSVICAILRRASVIIPLVMALGAIVAAGIGYGWLAAVTTLLAVIILLFLLQFIILPFTKLKIRAYRKIFFGDACLQDLPLSPEAAINATNLETGTLWTYSRRKMGDSSYEYPKDGGNPIRFKGLAFPLAAAVASSTAVPAFFPPLKIDSQYFEEPAYALRVKPRLSDGGLYDNQGIHKLTQPGSSYACQTVICSDGSEPFSFRFAGFNAFQVIYRANDIMMRRIKTMQFIRDVYSKTFEIAYFSLDWQYESCITGFVSAIVGKKILPTTLAYHNLPPELLAAPDKHRREIATFVKGQIGFDRIVSEGLKKEDIAKASLIKTGLSAFKAARIDLLGRHAACLTEIQVRLYCPTLLP